MKRKRNILVAEDTAMVRESLCNALQASGFEVRGCEDGIEALFAAGENHFDCAIADYRMPNMNGVELTRQLRMRFPSLIIIGVSSEYKDTEFLTAGADTFLPKPYSVEDIVVFLDTKMNKNEGTKI